MTDSGNPAVYGIEQYKFHPSVFGYLSAEYADAAFIDYSNFQR